MGDLCVCKNKIDIFNSEYCEKLIFQDNLIFLM